MKGLYLEAVDWYKKAIECGATNVNSGVYILLGEVYIRMHRMENAKKTYEKVRKDESEVVICSTKYCI